MSFFLAKLDLGLFISFFLVCLFLFLHQSHDREETAGRQKTKVLTIIATVDFPVMLSSDTVVCLTNAIFSLSLSLKQGSQMSEHVCQAAILHSCIIVTWHSIPDFLDLATAEITF